MPLLVYKSSAGSGKTTTLVCEYLKITLKDPFVFNRVLAITFTNNAANEMKQRILLALEKLISEEAWSDGELIPLIESIGIERKLLIGKARLLQQLIIHRYDEFAISTIDSFVHRIIRTFATDVKLPQNFEVVIENDDIVPDIVDELFGKVGSDTDLTNIMVKFVMSQTENEKNHDLGSLIHEFVNKQFGEDGFYFSEKISELSSGDFVTIIEKMIEKIAILKKTITSNAKEALDVIHSSDLGVDDFTRKNTGVYGYFDKVSKLKENKHLNANSYVTAAIEDDVWTAKKTADEVKNRIDQIKDELVLKFNEIQNDAGEFFLLSSLNKKIYALALTNQIRNILSDYTDRTQKVHISEFNKRISKEIADQPVPFIYERLGIKYWYFLIDEFQDTSVLQWQNLLPLVEESLSNNNFNLLVGDAKQAIYRFRSGEVELFANLPKLYGNDGSQKSIAVENLLKESYQEKSLDLNWRSKSEIVQFNNDFFDVIKSSFSERLHNIYKGHTQIIPKQEKKQGGYISIDLIENENPEVYSELRLEKIVCNVDKLIEAGYRLKDICVLTRTNYSAVEIASYLLKNKFSVVTSESLLLTNSAEVRLVVSFIRLLNQPNISGILADFIQNLIAVRNNGSFDELYTLANEKSDEGLNEVLFSLGLNIDIKKMAALPVFEIAESFIYQQQLSKPPNTYLRFFLDFVLVAQENSKGSIDTFLELWGKKKEKLYITMPDGGDAIKIMTIHKAKGLKFESVILDIADRGTKKGKSEYWDNINVDGFEELKVGLFSISKDLENIGLEDIFEDENDKTKLDFINMVYVAFTRPVSALMMVAHSGGKKKEKFSELLLQYLSVQKEWQEGNEETFEKGKLTAPLVKANSDENEVLILDEVISSSWENQIRIAPADEVYWQAIDSKPARVYGNLIHAMLAKITVEEDVEDVVDAYLLSAIIDEQEAKEVQFILNKVVSHPKLKKYFSNQVIVKNETEILDPLAGSNVFQRPDRVVMEKNILVVIDYKTGEKDKKHTRQIEQYGRIFHQLGYTNVELRLVYISNKVEVVEVASAALNQPQLF